MNIFEKLIKNELLSKLSHVISPTQHGFVPNRSTTTNLLEYTSYIAHQLDKSLEVHTIYTDLSKAFDTVDHNLLLTKLRNYGISGQVLKWLGSYLVNRKVQVSFNGSNSIEFTPTSGVPQGSVLGPLLYVLFTNDLPDCVGCRILMYADDIKLYGVVGRQEDCRALQANVDAFVSWCETNRLTINVEKCASVVFSKKHTSHAYDYNIKGQSLKRTGVVEDLGITFDSHLSFNQHYRKICAKGYKNTGFVMRLTKEFNNVSCMKTLFNAITRSALEYASTIWSPYHRTHSHEIERIQKKFTRYLFFKMNHSKREYADRLKILNMISLENRRKVNDMLILYRLVNGHIPNPAEPFRLRATPYSARRLPSFEIPAVKTGIGQSTHPINRCLRIFNFEFSTPLIFAPSVNIYRADIERKLNQTLN